MNTKHDFNMRKYLKSLFAILLVITLTCTSAYSRVAYTLQGDIDPTFGSDGLITTTISDTSTDFGLDVVIQPDGKIVVAGMSTGLGFLILRYQSDGTLDTSFGSGGKVIPSVGERAFAVALQPDGKIVATGHGPGVDGMYNDITVARFTADGTLDSSFGNGGKVTTDYFGYHDYGYDLVVLDDGKILVSGAAQSRFDVPDMAPYGYHCAMVRYNPDGTLDSSFGTSGKVLTDISPVHVNDSYSSACNSIALRDDGSFVAAGGYLRDFLLIAYEADGNLDTSFGIDGVVRTDFANGWDDGRAIWIQSDGKILVAGWATVYANRDFALARYNPDGSLDTSFGTNGKVSVQLGGEDEAYGIALQPDGKILVAGGVNNAPPTGFAVLRFNPDGSLDSTFGTEGKIITDFGNDGLEGARSVVLQSDGKIVVVGTDFLGSYWGPGDVAVARYFGEIYNQPPLAEAGGPYTGFVGETITLDASASSDPNADPLSYEWDLNNDGVFDDANGISVGHIFDQAGEYTVGLNVTDTLGLSNVDTAVVTVASSCLAPPIGLIAWWPGNGSAQDIVGGHDALLRGDASFGPGLVDQAFVLDGNGDFVEVNDPIFNFGTNDFTVGLWANFNTTAGEQVLIEKYIEALGDAGRTGWTFTKLADNRIRLHAGNPGGGIVESVPLNIPDNTWTHFALRRSGNVFTLFVNGAEVASGTLTANLDSTSTLKFGHRGNPQDTPGSLDDRQFYFNGSMDDVEIYERALTNAEIESIFSGSCVEPPYNPSFAAHLPGNQVHAYNWTAGSTLHLTIDDPDIPGSSDFEKSEVVPDNDLYGNTWTVFELPGFELKPGQFMSITDGTTTKTHVVRTVKVNSVNPTTEIIIGTAEPNTEVGINAHYQPGGDYVPRKFTTDEYGNWSIDLSVPGPNPGEDRTYDIVPGSWGTAFQWDEDNDSTFYEWRVPNNSIFVAPLPNGLHAWDWPDGAWVTLTIDDPHTLQSPDYTETKQASYSAPWAPQTTLVEFVNGAYDIQAGDDITVTDGITTKTHITTGLTVDQFDVNADTVTGTAEPGSTVSIVRVCDTVRCSERTVTANQSGDWVADFSLPGDANHPETIDIRTGTEGIAYQYDNDGDATQINWRVPNPHFSVQFPWNEVHGYEWPMGANITLTIDDSSNGEGVDYTQTQAVGTENFNPPYDTWIGFRLGDFEIMPGDTVTMTDGNITKTHITQEIAVTNVDPVADTVSGTAVPGTDVGFGGVCDENGCAYRNVPVDASGHWLADFSVPGDQDNEQQLFDLRPGSSGEAQRIDEDGDGTVYQWRVPNPAFQVRANDNLVEGWEWILGDTVTIEVNDPSTPQDIDYSGTATVGVADWDPNQTWFSATTDNYDLKVGDTVTVKDETITKQLLVTDFRITNVDLDTDRVYGKAEPGQYVNIWTCWHDNPCVNRDETADANGDWFTDFSVPGEQDWEQETADLQTESWIDSSAQDDDGDQVMSGWYVNGYTLHAVPTHPEIHGHDWPTGADVTLTIDDDNDPNNGVLYTRTKNADDDPWCGYPCFDLAGVFDLQVGQYVTMTDGVVTKTVHVSVLKITEVDREHDILRGTADPGSRVAVNIWSQDGLARYVTTGADGTWVADFSVFGDEDFEQFTTDIAYGDNGRAIQLNPDGTDDGTLEYWNLDWVAPDTVPLVVALNSDVTLDRPEYSIEAWTVTNLLWEPLFKLSPQNEPIPAAATGYVFSPDRRTITITLRDDMYWSDGQPVTAQHYVDGFKRLLAPDTATEYGFLLFDIVGAEEYNAGTASDVSGLVALNDTTLQITLKTPAVYYPAVLSDPGMIPARLDLIAQYGDAWILPQNFVGNGPYTLLEHDRGHILLAKNAFYYDAANVAFEQIGFDIISDQNEQFESYKRSDVDVLIDAPQSALDDPNFIPEREYSDAPGVYFLGLNTQRAPTDDPKVRMALASAIDRSALLDNVLNMPWLQDATGVIPPELLGYQGDDVGFGYDPAYAQSLLAEAGYPNGVGLPTVHLYGTDVPRTHQILEEVAQQWRTVLNISVETHYLADFNQWVGACQEDPGACPYNAIRQGWMVDYIDPHNIINDLFNPDSWQAKRLGWDDPRYRELIDLSRGEQDPAQRLAYIQEAEQILVEQDAAVIPLYFIQRVSLVKPGYETVYGIVPYFEQWDWASINQPPDANAGPDRIVYAGEIITLDASASSDPEAGMLTYQWDLDNDGQYDDASSVTVTTSFYQPGNHVIALQVTDEEGSSDTDTVTVVVLAWTIKGFYQPVDMNGVYNTVKGGSTVPLKFEIFAGPTELTDIANVRGLTYAETMCNANVVTDEIELVATGGTSLRYDAASGQFIYNWKTPKAAGKCYRVTLTLMDGSSLVAYFKLK